MCNVSVFHVFKEPYRFAPRGFHTKSDTSSGSSSSGSDVSLSSQEVDSSLHEESTQSTLNQRRGRCVVCWCSPATRVLVPCGHQCVCAAEAESFVGGVCPICRTMVEKQIAVYTV